MASPLRFRPIPDGRHSADAEDGMGITDMDASNASDIRPSSEVETVAETDDTDEEDRRPVSESFNACTSMPPPSIGTPSRCMPADWNTCNDLM